ncbi:TerB family tellurite resistance protein [Campylobacter sp. JMF_04 NA10]|nr:TerB family tellurite resistance protein [Campylobacter sp. JMF_04 NA10]
MSDNKVPKMVLLRLAMDIDGVKDEEVNLFSEIAEEYGLNSDEIDEVEEIFEELLSSDDKYYEDIFEKYAKKSIDADYKKSNMQFLWTLINMGFIDKDYSEYEQGLVDIYCEIAKIDKVFARELEDTAEAMSAIVKQKEFLKNSKMSSDKMKVFESELNKNQAVLENSISEIISLSSTLK